MEAGNTRISINDRISISDIDAWRFGQETDVLVGIAADFEPGAEGVALSVLRTAMQGRAKIVLFCEFDEPSTVELFEASFLGTAVGISLVRIAREIRFGRKAGTASANLKPLIALAYKNKNGVFGVGKKKSIVCVDPNYTVPPILEDASGKEASFPLPSVFERVLRSQVSDMGLPRILNSSVEASLINFVYELFRNSVEHGISPATVIPRSTRAIVLEKIGLQGVDVSTRHISPDTRNYLSRISEITGKVAGFGVLCITIADQGLGIQGTLPPKEKEERESDRLARAFIEGESRKPRGAIERGKGLASALSAAHKLHALLRVSSGGLIGTEDFSTGEQKYPRISFDDTKRMSSRLMMGTCISLFVPEYQVSPDQSRLFSRDR